MFTVLTNKSNVQNVRLCLETLKYRPTSVQLLAVHVGLQWTCKTNYFRISRKMTVSLITFAPIISCSEYFPWNKHSGFHSRWTSVLQNKRGRSCYVKLSRMASHCWDNHMFDPQRWGGLKMCQGTYLLKLISAHIITNSPMIVLCLAKPD